MFVSRLFITLLVVYGLTTATHGENVQCYTRDSATNQQKRIYTLALGHDYGAFEYIDEDGRLAGFHHDLIAEVCEAAGIDCRTVWEPYQNCITSAAAQHSRAGDGLMDGWYDGCIGWGVTVERMGFLTFTASYLINARGGFIVKANDSSFDPNNFINKKIGFMDGYVDDEKCVARNMGKVLPAANVVHFKSVPELKKAITDGTVDAGYTSEGVWGGDTAFKHVGNWYSCRIRGESVACRKDSDFPAKWNEGFDKLVSNGRFKKLCKEAKTKHKADEKGYELLCV